jgi:hypothetical protein
MNITHDVIGKAGQLGNQMFQYAQLVGVKYKLGCDILFENQMRKQSYLFDFFDMNEYVFVDEFKYKQTYCEKHFHFDEKVFDIKEDTNFAGYFQTEKYFTHCEDIIRKEFTFKNHIQDNVLDKLKKYENKTLVSIHVRRGDYMAYPKIHPLCSLDYYNIAMNYFDDVQFLCFSNDIEWCKQNIKAENIDYFSNDLEVDMCMISKCHHHIIANSTFSWWGAWLSNHKNKKIFAPNLWFGPDGFKDFYDIYGKNFIII